MITSQKQYFATIKQLDLLQKSNESFEHLTTPQIIREAAYNQRKSLIDELSADIHEYELIKSGEAKNIQINSVDDLLKSPIRYRLSKKMSIDAFGRMVEISARQIHRYESECYRNTTTATLVKILSKLDINLNGSM